MQGKAWVMGEWASPRKAQPDVYSTTCDVHSLVYQQHRHPSAVAHPIHTQPYTNINCAARLLPRHFRTLTVTNAIVASVPALAFFDRCCIRPAPFHLARRPVLCSRLSLIRHTSSINIFAHPLRNSSQLQHNHQLSTATSSDSPTRPAGSNVAT
jgi:hypothetical protein